MKDNLYQTPQWKSLNPVERAELIPVIEGEKRGALVRGNWTTFVDVMEMAGLGYEGPDTNLLPDPRLNASIFIGTREEVMREVQNGPVFYVANEEALGEHARKQIMGAAAGGLRNADFQRIDGWFLGYPDCCIEEYVRERTADERKAASHGQRHRLYRFGRELEESITRQKNRSLWISSNERAESKVSYPDVFDYAPLSFTPCSVDCPEALRLLGVWKELIVKNDPEAGEELVYLNRDEMPKRLAHKAYLEAEYRRRHEDAIVDAFRRSII